MAKLTEHMTTRCVGRYLVDLPQDFVLNSEGGQDIDGVKIDVLPMKEAEFRLLLANRKKELENTLMVGSEKYPFLREIIPLPDHAPGMIFDRAKSDVSGGRLNRTLELLAWKNGYRLLATINARDTTFPEDAHDEIVRENIKTNLPAKLTQLLDVYKRTRGRDDGDIPSEQGVCILRGFVSGPPSDEEGIGLFYHLKTAEDVYFSLHSHSNFRENDTLLDRVGAMKKYLQPEKGEQFLRTAKRPVNDIHGEEILLKRLSDANENHDDLLVHDFTFDANSKIGSAKTPVVQIDLKNGLRKPGPDRAYNAPFPPPITKATLSEAEAIALWDAVIPTLRMRPGAL